MTTAERPFNEEARLRALWDAEVLDTPPEQKFDDLTRLATSICGTPMATISLVDADRQWFKSRIGLDVSETPRNESFCTHAILGDDVLVVRDATADERFRDLPLVVGPPGMRFYAGAPIRLETGETVGTVCALDRVPRELSADQIEALRALARMAATSLDARRGAAALRRANEQLAELLDSTYDLVHSVDPDGRILFANRAWKEALGYSEREIAALRILEIVAPESLAHSTATFSRIFQGEPNKDVRTVLMSRDGRRVFVEGSSSCKMEGGRALWTRTVFRDVTARTEAQRDRHRFLTATAEAIRAPLTAVRGAIDMLGDPGAAEAAPELRELAATTTDTLLRTVQDVIDLERLETGSFEIRTSSLRVDDLLRAAQQEVRRLADDRAVTLRVDAAPGLLVRGDREPLEQAVFNLLANAVRRSPSGRTVTVRAARRAHSTVRLSFGDEGDSFPPDERPLIFEVASRWPIGMRRTDSAATMALAVTKAIVQAHGGQVGVGDRPSGGELWMDLPGA